MFVVRLPYTDRFKIESVGETLLLSYSEASPNALPLNNNPSPTLIPGHIVWIYLRHKRCRHLFSRVLKLAIS